MTPRTWANVLLILTGMLIVPANASAAIQSLNSQTGKNQTFQNDSNITISSANNIHSLEWQGLLPISRGGTGNDAFAEGSVIFMGQNKFRQDNNNFFWDRINNRLGIGTSSPSTTLDVTGNAKVNSLTSTLDSIINTLNIGLGGGLNSSNLRIGSNTLTNNTDGIHNLAIGSAALSGITTSSDNTAVGFVALGGSSNSGEQNTAVGSQASSGNTTGSYNAAFGFRSLWQNVSGAQNVALGSESLINNTSGGNNVTIGFRSGMFQADGSTALTSPEGSIYIGSQTRGNDNDDANSIVVGASAIGAGANKTVIGNSSMTDIYFGSASGNADIHATKLFLGSSTNPGCIVMGDSDGNGVSYLTVNDGVLAVSTTQPSACQ